MRKCNLNHSRELYTAGSAPSSHLCAMESLNLSRYWTSTSRAFHSSAMDFAFILDAIFYFCAVRIAHITKHTMIRAITDRWPDEIPLLITIVSALLASWMVWTCFAAERKRKVTTEASNQSPSIYPPGMEFDRVVERWAKQGHEE
ncbi:hypothetical protein FB567DRAFT_316075 [Paraphoma chrysanthemicola]|uniref:Uncharacterized protein n=1 Tax=Paraphoma chrysanthemicola TaxID=798071 RepID=A0A8K0RC23_9PLEO|nr:hypothetical protein FB567DRAFT_316075 [Paraphoma chrysanthemicola]